MKREFEVTKEAVEVGEFLAGVLADVAKAYADGKLDLKIELPPIIFNAIGSGTAAVDNIAAIKDEFSAAPCTATLSVIAPLLPAVDALLIALKNKPTV
jgi:hypothetical protein